jgi:hypothetical protein
MATLFTALKQLIQGIDCLSRGNLFQSGLGCGGWGIANVFG